MVPERRAQARLSCFLSHECVMKFVAVMVVSLLGVAGSVSAQTVPPDVQFMRDMIPHHQQAIEMSRLAQTRARRNDIKLLAERISVSQVSEIQLMQDWLKARGDTVQNRHEHMAHTGGDHLMPGMLSSEEMARLAAARGPDFDRLFLQYMIRHHEGALTMVEDLFAKQNSVQNPLLFQVANNIDADQRAEIARMKALLSKLK